MKRGAAYVPGSLNPRRCKATCGYPNQNRTVQMRRECPYGRHLAVFCILRYGILLCYDFRRRQIFVNDPSEGSPTDTLLRLLLPLSSRTCMSSQHTKSRPEAAYGTNPKCSFSMTIGSSDGRCVQRAGT